MSASAGDSGQSWVRAGRLSGRAETTSLWVDFDEVMVAVLEEVALPADWRADPPPASTQSIGDAWVLASRSAVLRVPSVVVPLESNYILNPRHPDFARPRIEPPMPFPLDPRLPLP
jgi:RES domain-containing protein